MHESCKPMRFDCYINNPKFGWFVCIIIFKRDETIFLSVFEYNYLFLIVMVWRPSVDKITNT